MLQLRSATQTQKLHVRRFSTVTLPSDRAKMTEWGDAAIVSAACVGSKVDDRRVRAAQSKQTGNLSVTNEKKRGLRSIFMGEFRVETGLGPSKTPVSRGQRYDASHAQSLTVDR